MRRIHRWPVLLVAAVLLWICGTAAAADMNPDLATVRRLIGQSDTTIDLAQAKVTIDRLIAPDIDTVATLRQIDALAAAIRRRIPPQATSQTKLEILVTSLSLPGPWNDYRPFTYDLADPFGTKIQNKLLSTYLATRKGNCVSMPVLFVILGQRIGLDVTLSTAPLHVLAKFKNDAGEWVNIEVTSYGTKQNTSYQQEMAITAKAMQSGIYLRPLSRRESLGVIVETLMESYGKRGHQTQRIAVADLLLQLNPKDVSAMLHKGSAYSRLVKERYTSKFQSLDQLTAAQRADFEMLGRNNRLWFEKAEALGWRESAKEQDSGYLRRIQQVKAQQRGAQ